MPGGSVLRGRVVCGQAPARRGVLERCAMRARVLCRQHLLRRGVRRRPVRGVHGGQGRHEGRGLHAVERRPAAGQLLRRWERMHRRRMQRRKVRAGPQSCPSSDPCETSVCDVDAKGCVARSKLDGTPCTAAGSARICVAGSCFTIAGISGAGGSAGVTTSSAATSAKRDDGRRRRGRRWRRRCGRQRPVPLCRRRVQRRRLGRGAARLAPLRAARRGAQAIEAPRCDLDAGARDA